MTKRWVFAERGQVEEPAELHPVLSQLLVQRGIRSKQEAEDFFNPSWDVGIHDPFSFMQMGLAVDRIMSALKSGERITVHGDYDADGVTGSAVLISAMREVEQKFGRHGSGTRVDSYIPHRDKEGYGLHPETVTELQGRGTTLLVTVDCGIACPAEIDLAKEAGMDTIVVDHHQFGETLPNAILVHPKIPGETYPFQHLAAVGVAWKVACALFVRARESGLDIPDGWEKWLLDLVAIATVTDMVPMVGENRVLETYGLRVLNMARRPGIKALLAVAGAEPGALTSKDIGFTLGPRINAAGRMDHASLALRLLLAEDETSATDLANQVEAQNRDRQKATLKIMEEAGTKFDVGSRAPLLALWSENWSPSLVGLVAGKYLDMTGRPTIVMGRYGDRWVGSGRSFSAFDITASMKRAGEGFLTHVGGHVQACGFSFHAEREVEEFVRRVLEDAAPRLQFDDCVPMLQVDAHISLSDIQWPLVEGLIKFEPFGEGNRRPVFATCGAELVSVELIGKTGKTARCMLRDVDGTTRQFIGFNFAEHIMEFAVGSRIDAAFEIGINEWNGRRDIQCRFVDVRVHELECVPVVEMAV